MSFTWKAIEEVIEHEVVEEIRENVDFVLDNLACIAHRDTHHLSYYAIHNSTLRSKDWGTHYGTHYSSVKVTYESADNVSHCTTQNVSAKTTHRSGLNSTSHSFHSTDCYTNKSTHCKSW